MNLSIPRARELDALVALLADQTEPSPVWNGWGSTAGRQPDAYVQDLTDPALIEALTTVARAAGIAYSTARQAVLAYPASAGQFEAAVVAETARRERVATIIAAAKARAAGGAA
ncbi:hypothetical protein ABZU25_33905 [Micromonospora sp. NPDC005215]|uniref:hypothetical protein n=1 Tax=Micromonospora sp. NPDC005215 TaxID=3157024 RepID=UPI0033AA489D